LNTDILQQLPLFGNETETIAIPLTQGQFTIVDATDSDLAQFKWYARCLNRNLSVIKFYAHRNVKLPDETFGSIALHRLILGRMLGRQLDKSEFVDHVSGDTLLNTRSNLRLATPEQNAINRGRSSKNTSGYKGVSFSAQMGKWKAAVTLGGNKRHLGFFDTPEAAYEAYCKAARELHGEFYNPG
jgi:hypothetical protein